MLNLVQIAPSSLEILYSDLAAISEEKQSTHSPFQMHKAFASGSPSSRKNIIKNIFQSAQKIKNTPRLSKKITFIYQITLSLMHETMRSEEKAFFFELNQNIPKSISNKQTVQEPFSKKTRSLVSIVCEVELLLKTIKTENHPFFSKSSLFQSLCRIKNTHLDSDKNLCNILFSIFEMLERNLSQPSILLIESLLQGSLEKNQVAKALLFFLENQDLISTTEPTVRTKITKLADLLEIENPSSKDLHPFRLEIEPLIKFYQSIQSPEEKTKFQNQLLAVLQILHLTLSDNAYKERPFGTLLDQMIRIAATPYQVFDETILEQAPFATTRKVHHLIKRKNYAIKTPLFGKELELFEEFRLLRRISEANPNNDFAIIRVINWIAPNTLNRNHWGLVLELQEENLARKFTKNTSSEAPLSLIKKIGRQLIKALGLLQDLAIVHGNLNPSSIFFKSGSDQTVLADFSSSFEIPIGSRRVTIFRGSEYASPEVVLGETEKYGHPIDMWALGCTLAELFQKKVLFPTITLKKGSSYSDTKTSKERDVFYTQMGTLDISREISTVFNVKKNKGLIFFNDEIEIPFFIDLLEKMLKPSPAERISPLDALKHPFFSSYRPIQEKLGKGSYGKVSKIYHAIEKKYYAIKLPHDEAIEELKHEARTLDLINSHNSDGSFAIVRKVDWIAKESQINNCWGLVLDLHGATLHDAIRKKEFPYASFPLIKEIGRQLLKALSFLERLKIVHSDLKPANILLKDRDLRAVVIIDFGESFTPPFAKELDSYRQTRWYRDPDCALQTRDYSYPIDMWSLACVLMELFQKTVLFPAVSVLHLVQLHQPCLGHYPDKLIEKKTLLGTIPRYRQENRFSIETRVWDTILLSNRKAIPQETTAETKNFIDLIQRMLHLDQKNRISASNALNHPFFA